MVAPKKDAPTTENKKTNGISSQKRKMRPKECGEPDRCQRQITANHEYLTMRKVDELQNTIHHGVAKSDKRIDKARCKAVAELLEK